MGAQPGQGGRGGQETIRAAFTPSALLDKGSTDILAEVTLGLRPRERETKVSFSPTWNKSKHYYLSHSRALLS